MKKQIITILSIFAFIGGFLVFYQNHLIEYKTQNVNQQNQQSNTKQSWESKTDDRASVIVTITPIDILPQSKEWKFDVAMNTHSVELQDPTKSAVLIDDYGAVFKPINWNGPTEGHHMNGVLVFNRVAPTPALVELKISGIGDVARSFSWKP